ncbi:hypothetical protein DPMN_097418 [Dreissena polymorpha]|uniref:Uncharacterized protein n=1 Tax=Dreissena polymorpha TaxID=45954 RepID=A0A9D4LB85_DREPO|nr:hypothetical protein DPMN_097418 [Dreissena polymorpha]
MTWIQSTLNVHTNRWKSKDKEHTGDTVPEIPSLKRKLEITNVKSLQIHVETLSVKLDEYDLSIQQYRDICVDITETNNYFDNRLSFIEQ